MTVDAAFAVALAHHEAGRVEEARAGYQTILRRDPGHAESLHLLGLIKAQAGEPEAGAKLIEQAIGMAPGRAPHRNSLGLAYRALGRDADAVSEFHAALALRPGSAEIHNNLATSLRDLGQHDEAIAAYRAAASGAPEVATIWYNLASLLAENGAGEEAEACFRRAISLRPDFADALANYGRWLMSQSRWIDAVAWLGEAVRLAPESPRNWNNLGISQHELGRAREAEASYRRAVGLDPNFADAHYNLGCLVFGDGRTDEAVACHQAALAADPSHGAARLAVCMARLPIVYRGEAEVTDRRAQYIAGLEELTAAVARPDVAASVAASIGSSQPFFLPYQGRNDRDPQAAYGGLVCRLLTQTEPRDRPALRPSRRIRLGIISGFFLDHTIFRLFLLGWLTQLNRDRFELMAFHTGRSRDAETDRAANLCDRFIIGMSSPAAWRSAVVEAAPHILLYPEIGIDPVAARLAAQRLAPVQCVSWGHPETTGMPTLDYFLSADLMEPPDGDAHYTERLIRMPNLGLHWTPDGRDPPCLSRADLGFDPSRPVYWSGQALYKYAPEFDVVFPRIAAAVGPCQFVFIGFARSAAVTSLFRDRLGSAFAAFGLDADRYCVLLQPMPQERFVASVGLADVILDTIGWSGGRSTLDCLSQNPAIVTLPGPFMRGRHTGAILRRIGCEETIAESLDEYVAIAARLGLDASWRAAVRKGVGDRKHLAFHDTAYIRALETFLMTEAAGQAKARGAG